MHTSSVLVLIHVNYRAACRNFAKGWGKPGVFQKEGVRSCKLAASGGALEDNVKN